MASIELDPLFMKALALLRSKSKDSTDLLKQMLDDVLGKTTGKTMSPEFIREVRDKKPGAAGRSIDEMRAGSELVSSKCHTPPVTDTDPNDPRLVWYCAQCKRNMKKMVAKKPANLPETVITTGSSSSSSSSSSSAKDQEKNQDQTSPMNLFRRADPKPSPTSTSSAQQPFGGLASYAANLTNRQHSSSSKSSSSGTSRIITSTGAKIAPSSITSRSSSTSGTSTTMSGKALKPQSVQRSTSVSQSGKWPNAPSASSAAAKAMSSSSASGKALPQTSTASAMKRLHMMKKKASKR
eukprot:XP_011672813.1 PREDICTED: integrator complex subunit 12 [Strongylocentrotus purpuratus]